MGSSVQLSFSRQGSWDVDGITGNEMQMLNCTAQMFDKNMLQGNDSGL